MIQTVVNPYQNPRRWEYIEICGGIASPGVIPKNGVHGFERRYNFDPKNGYGMYGSILTFAFRPAAEGSFTIWTWTSEQYDSMGNFLQLLEYDPTKLPQNPRKLSPTPGPGGQPVYLPPDPQLNQIKAIDIFYPSLATIGIRRVVTTSISPPIHLGGLKYEWRLSFIEFRPPPKISAVSTPVLTKKTTNRIDDPQDALLTIATQQAALDDQAVSAYANGRSALGQ